MKMKGSKDNLPKNVKGQSALAPEVMQPSKQPPLVKAQSVPLMRTLQGLRGSFRNLYGPKYTFSKKKSVSTSKLAVTKKEKKDVTKEVAEKKRLAGIMLNQGLDASICVSSPDLAICPPNVRDLEEFKALFLKGKSYPTSVAGKWLIENTILEEVGLEKANVELILSPDDFKSNEINLQLQALKELVRRYVEATVRNTSIKNKQKYEHLLSGVYSDDVFKGLDTKEQTTVSQLRVELKKELCFLSQEKLSIQAKIQSLCELRDKIKANSKINWKEYTNKSNQIDFKKLVSDLGLSPIKNKDLSRKLKIDLPKQDPDIANLVLYMLFASGTRDAENKIILKCLKYDGSSPVFLMDYLTQLLYEVGLWDAITYTKGTRGSVQFTIEGKVKEILDTIDRGGSLSCITKELDINRIYKELLLLKNIKEVVTPIAKEVLEAISIKEGVTSQGKAFVEELKKVLSGDTMKEADAFKQKLRAFLKNGTIEELGTINSAFVSIKEKVKDAAEVAAREDDGTYTQTPNEEEHTYNKSPGEGDKDTYSKTPAESTYSKSPAPKEEDPYKFTPAGTPIKAGIGKQEEKKTLVPNRSEPKTIRHHVQHRLLEGDRSNSTSKKQTFVDSTTNSTTNVKQSLSQPTVGVRTNKTGATTLGAASCGVEALITKHNVFIANAAGSQMVM